MPGKCHDVDARKLRYALARKGWFMRATVERWGNSGAVRIPSAVLQAADLRLNDSVDIREESGRIVIEPQPRKQYDLAKLVKGITRANLHDAVDYNLSHKCFDRPVCPLRG